MNQEQHFLYKRRIVPLLLLVAVGTGVIIDSRHAYYVHAQADSDDVSTTQSDEGVVAETESDTTPTAEENSSETLSSTSTESDGDETSLENQESNSVSSSTATSTDEFEGTFLNANMSTEFMSSSTETVATSTDSTNQGVDTETGTSASSSTTTIESGTAVALANIINIVNSNFINSDGVVFFSNFLETITDALDLRALYDSVASFGCSLTECEGPDTTVNVSNSALIENLLLLQALSGNNVIEGDDGVGVIDTGNAYAGLNLVNIANMNFIDSNYLLVTLNAFNDVNNDIIFPSTELLLSNLAYSPDNASINLEGSGVVQNNITLDADSGANELGTSQGGSITTGATGATSNVFNQINSSLVGGQNLTILFRIHGNWVGEVFGAPDDLLWHQSDDGSVILFDSSTAGGGGVHQTGERTIDSSNNANINNNVNVVALTGENRITGTETGIITTGNAYAGANIVNLANGNVVGRNWVLAIINIFGDFNGNIAFGRPDLWVGEIIDAPQKVKNGSTLNTTLTVINNGDSPATQVVLEDDYDEAHLIVKDASHAYTKTDDGTLRFELGRIPAGGAVEVWYKTEVTNTRGGQELVSTVEVSGRETDNNITDNTETTSIKTYRSSGGGATRIREIARHNEQVVSMDAEVLGGSDTLQVMRVFKNFPLTSKYPAMRQVVVLRNPTNHTIPTVIFEDILKDPSGVVVQTERWELGDVVAGEQIELGYTLSFAADAPVGTYRLYSKVSTADGRGDVHENGAIVFTHQPPTNELIELASRAVGFVTDISSPWPRVAGASSETSPYFSNDVGMMLPTLTSHSMSTATRQQDAFGTLSAWIERLYAYVSSLFSNVAPAIAMVWGDVENYKP